uniref:Uncharacterized protein n=1 Tax=Siphoviridae sp. ctwNf2 TaxID=2827597 RepID=A0A8S5RRF2_9CAUD|nr:MAG TPA: hypothetical protein [Siphoviridae sp. ctwNf2]
MSLFMLILLLLSFATFLAVVITFLVLLIVFM